MPEKGTITPQSLNLRINRLDFGMNKNSLNKEGDCLPSSINMVFEPCTLSTCLALLQVQI